MTNSRRFILDRAALPQQVICGFPLPHGQGSLSFMLRPFLPGYPRFFAGNYPSCHPQYDA
ncbi:MAG: hypothetical protein IH889_08625 [Planctomycetes bacterium]|nr:hypothetical protein [Planctomycetota bacterium]